MKKIAFLFGIALVLSGCLPPSEGKPQVTVMAPSAMTVTLPPAPTPTLHPKFAELQQTIVDSGKRFTLNGADGLIYDGDVPIPGMTVVPDGTMTLTVNGETITLDPADVDFDDENGIGIKGYEFQDTDGDGNPDSWVKANETVTMGGVTLTLDENGVVTDMEATGASEEVKAENLAKVDPKAWGFEAGEAQIIKDTTGTHIVVDGENVAKWVGTEWEWDWEVMEGLEGGNPLFDFAKTVEMNGKSPADMKSAREDSAKIHDFAVTASRNTSNKLELQPVYLYDDNDIGHAVIGYSRTASEDNVMGGHNKDTEAVADATVFIITNSGKVVSMKINDVELFRRTFN